MARIDYSHIVLIIAIWPGDRIRRPEHSTVEHGSSDESVYLFQRDELCTKSQKYSFIHIYRFIFDLDTFMK